MRLDSLAAMQLFFKGGSLPDFSGLGIDLDGMPNSVIGTTFPEIAPTAMDEAFKETQRKMKEQQIENLKKLEAVQNKNLADIKKQQDLNAAQLKSANEQKAQLVAKRNEIAPQTPKNEKQLGFWDKAKAFGKGIVHGVTGLFTDDKGHFSWKKTAITVGVTAVAVTADVLTGGALTPALIGAGVLLGGAQVYNGGKTLYDAKTNADTLKGYEEIGGGTFDIATSLIGLKGAGSLKAARAASAAKKTTALAGEMEKAVEIASEGARVGRAEVAEQVAASSAEHAEKIKNADAEVVTAIGDWLKMSDKKIGFRQKRLNRLEQIVIQKERALADLREVQVQPSTTESVSAVGSTSNSASKELVLRAIEDVKQGKKGARERLVALTKDDPNFTKVYSLATGKTNSTPVIDAEFADSLVTDIKKLSDVGKQKEILAAIEKIKGATTRNKALNAFEDAKKLAEGDNNIIFLLESAKDSFIERVPRFGLNVKSRIQNNLTDSKVDWSTHKIAKPIAVLTASNTLAQSVSGTINAAAEAQTQAEVATIDDATKQIDESVKSINDAQTQISEIEKQAKTSKLQVLVAQASALDIDVHEFNTNTDTISEIDKVIAKLQTEISSKQAA